MRPAYDALPVERGDITALARLFRRRAQGRALIAVAVVSAVMFLFAVAVLAAPGELSASDLARAPADAQPNLILQGVLGIWMLATSSAVVCGALLIENADHAIAHG